MSAPPRQQFVFSVISNTPLCRDHFGLWLEAPSFPPTEPGQFVQIACRDLDECYSEERELTWEQGQAAAAEGQELMSPLAMLRRPFSLAGRRTAAGAEQLYFIHRVVGTGTAWLSQLKTGDKVNLLGPLGNRFQLPGKDQTAILVGGGVGIPPMLYLAEKLAGRSALAFCGALTKDLLPLTIFASAPAPGPETFEPLPQIEEFSRHGIRAVISTDDGSYGFRGFVTQALERYLDAKQTGSSADRSVIYTCGPEPMMKRVAAIAIERGMECQVAVERAMACGMGTCQSCVIRVRRVAQPDASLPQCDWVYRLACTDGPIFRGSELLW